MTWYFNDQVIEAGDRYMITFDGTYATLFIASCVMADMGEYKVVFENSAGVDETTGKVTVKPVSTLISFFKDREYQTWNIQIKSWLLIVVKINCFDERNFSYPIHIINPIKSYF